MVCVMLPLSMCRVRQPVNHLARFAGCAASDSSVAETDVFDDLDAHVFKVQCFSFEGKASVKAERVR